MESSLGFQQKIIENQRRIEKFELDDPVKEEAVETAVLLTEIKTECFEFDPSAVIVQSWQEPPKEEIKETEDQNLLEKRISPIDLKEAPALDDSDDDFGPTLQLNESVKKSESKTKKEKIVEEVKPPEEPRLKRVCPYCAETLNKNGMTAHVSNINSSSTFS